MGLSIHYSGSFNPAASLPEMIEEVADIVDVLKWPYHIYNSNFPNPEFDHTYDNEIYGISFAPPESETIWLCFLSNRKMSGPVQLEFYGNDTDKDRQAMLYMLSTKTQYAGAQVHKMVIKILKHISTKYLVNFQLSDEGQFWETNDEKILDDRFKLYDQLLTQVRVALESFPMIAGESIEDYFERVLEKINEK